MFISSAADGFVEPLRGFFNRLLNIPESARRPAATFLQAPKEGTTRLSQSSTDAEDRLRRFTREIQYSSVLGSSGTRFAIRVGSPRLGT